MYDSFDNFISATLNRRIGEGECWDYINLLWSHLGSKYWTHPPTQPLATNHGVKWGWLIPDLRNLNTISHLTQITSLNQIKRGDMVVTYGGDYGHAGFANSSYDGSGYLELYSQKYANHKYVTLDSNDMATFAGAWRYDQWNIPPTPPAPTGANHTFKWALYANKLRNNF